MIAEVFSGAGVLVMGAGVFISYRTSRHVGKTNGSGSIAEMTETLVTLFAEHAKLDEERFSELGEQISHRRARH